MLILRWLFLMTICTPAAIMAQRDVLEFTDPCRGDGFVRPHAVLREADVMWTRRVWRQIDLRDERNAPFARPGGTRQPCRNLMSVIRHGLKDEGGITAYDPGPDGEDDVFRARMSGTALSAVLAGIDTLGPDAVGRFMIKEDWLFDRSRSVMEARIIGLAPMIEVRGEFGELRGFRPLFWLYYPECRQLFSWWNATVGADGARVTYEALLDGRHFAGEIVKVSNAHDRGIDGSSTGLDALLESEAIRKRLVDMGFDLWHY